MLRFPPPGMRGECSLRVGSGLPGAPSPGVTLELMSHGPKRPTSIRKATNLAVRMGPRRDTELISRKLADLHWILVARLPLLNDADVREMSMISSFLPALLIPDGPWPFAFADDKAGSRTDHSITDDSGSILQAALNHLQTPPVRMRRYPIFWLTAAWLKCFSSPREPALPRLCACMPSRQLPTAVACSAISSREPQDSFGRDL